MLVGETQSTENSVGHGFLLMANSSGDWINYRGLSGSERWGYCTTITITTCKMINIYCFVPLSIPLSAISLAISNDIGGDVLSCITGSLPESASSGGIPYLFIEVDTLQPPPSVLANSTISDGSNSNWLASPSGRMELLIIVFG